MITGKVTYFIITLLFLFLTLSSCGGEGLDADPPKKEGKIDAIKVYRNNCEKCHGWDGNRTARGKKLRSPNFTNPGWQARTSDTQIIEAITNGKRKMPSWKGELTAKEILAVGKYIRSFAKKRRR